MKEIFESFSDRRFPMPYINIKITREGTTAEQKAELIKGATELLARVLNKNPKTTIVTIEEVDIDSWGIGGDPVEIAREKGEAQDAKIARLEADKEEQEKELENLKKLLLQDGKKEDIPPLPEEETTEEIPVFMLNNNALKLKKEKKTKKSKSKNKK
jgi:4-oxalocrotonate tautomerase